MATFADTATAITTRFKQNWQLSPIVWPNTGARTPDGRDFVEFSVVEATAILTGMPVTHPRSTRASGLIVLLIRVGRGKGDQIARQYADAFAAIFTPPVNFSDVHLSAMVFNLTGQMGQYHTAKAYVPFHINTSP